MVLASLCAFSTLAAAAAIRAVDPTLNATVAQWTGLNSKDVEVTLYGTASQVKAQLDVLGPDFAPVRLNSTYASAGTTRVVDDRVLITAMSKRGTPQPPPDYLLCCPVSSWNWEPAYWTDIEDAIAEMSHLNLQHVAHPGTCSLAECFHNVGIWYCAEDSGITWYSDAALLGGYADDIAKTFPSVGHYNTVCGQQFSKGGSSWNVIVHGGCVPTMPS